MPIFLAIGVTVGAVGIWMFKDHSFVVPIFGSTGAGRDWRALAANSAATVGAKAGRIFPCCDQPVRAAATVTSIRVRSGR
jgi:hypothetical protein